jgi:hypothetical protein
MLSRECRTSSSKSSCTILPVGWRASFAARGGGLHTLRLPAAARGRLHEQPETGTNVHQAPPLGTQFGQAIADGVHPGIIG